jgi:hypothetical protein
MFRIIGIAFVLWFLWHYGILSAVVLFLGHALIQFGLFLG